MLALAIYREARGEGQDAKRAVGWVIRNRVQAGGAFGGDYCTVITRHAQFSSFNRGDPNATVFPRFADGNWRESVQNVVDVLEHTFSDPSLGATHYYDRSMDAHPPAWAAAMTPTVDIGAFHFFRQA